MMSQGDDYDEDHQRQLLHQQQLQAQLYAQQQQAQFQQQRQAVKEEPSPDDDAEDEEIDDPPDVDPDAVCPPAPPQDATPKKKRGRPKGSTNKNAGPGGRVKKQVLDPHEALTFAPRGVYYDVDTARLRCSCNHKPCDTWDQYGYTRHFQFKCHRRYEAERLDDEERNRLRECRDTYMRMNPMIEESAVRKKQRTAEGGTKIMTVEEIRVQEKHWMEMWKDARNELAQLRQDMREEPDEDVRAELAADIEGLKRRKGDWARLIGLKSGGGRASGGGGDFSVDL